MEEILHHVGCLRPCKKWNKLPINWLAGFLPSAVCDVSSLEGTAFKKESYESSDFNDKLMDDHGCAAGSDGINDHEV